MLEFIHNYIFFKRNTHMTCGW